MAHLQNAEEQSTTTTCSPIEQLDRMAEMMMDPANREIYILPFIKRTLRQFHLESFCEDSDVFNEVYLRAKNKLLKRENIENIYAWFKGAVFNVVREISKKNKVQDRAIQRRYKSDVEKNFTPDYATRQNCRKLSESMKLISEDDLELIILHWSEKLSWKEIGDSLVRKGKEFENNNVKSSRSCAKEEIEH